MSERTRIWLRKRTRDAISRAIYKAGSGLCWLSGWIDGGTDG